MLTALDLSPCVAPRWAAGGHAQTLWSFCLPTKKTPITAEKQWLNLPDGDQLSLLYSAGASSSWVIYLFHGLSGDASSPYMERTAKLCIDRGHSVYRVNHRGCGDGCGRARHPYHSGRGEDISEVLAHGRLHHPDKQHIAIGFSLSGNALLTLLTGLRGHVLPDYAISVNAPIDLHAACTQLSLGFNRIYDLYFVQQLRQALAQKYDQGHLLHKLNISRWSSVQHFDNLYTAPASGFTSAYDYYQRCSTHRHLHNINIPTILLTSQDDPFVPIESYQTAQLSPSTYLHVEATGGHMGYLSRRKTPLGDYRWLDYAILQCLMALTHNAF